MTRQPSFNLQSLESRMFLSIAPGPGPLGGGGLRLPPLPDDPTIQADLTKLQADRDKLRTDSRSGFQTINDDRKAIGDELQSLIDDKGEDAIKTALQPLKDQLKTDIQARAKAVRAGYQAINDKFQEFLPDIRDKKALRAAVASGVQADIDAAKKALSDDRTAAEAALKPMHDALETERGKWLDTIAKDHQAIEDKLAELDPKLTPLFDKLDADRKAADDKIKSDRDQLATDEQKLRDDLQKLKDSQNSTGGTTNT